MIKCYLLFLIDVYYWEYIRRLRMSILFFYFNQTKAFINIDVGKKINTKIAFLLLLKYIFISLLFLLKIWQLNIYTKYSNDFRPSIYPFTSYGRILEYHTELWHCTKTINERFKPCGFDIINIWTYTNEIV